MKTFELLRHITEREAVALGPELAAVLQAAFAAERTPTAAELAPCGSDRLATLAHRLSLATALTEHRDLMAQFDKGGEIRRLLMTLACVLRVIVDIERARAAPPSGRLN